MKQCFSIDEQFILISIKIFKFNNSSQWCIFFPLYVCAHKANDICINTYNLNRYNSSYTLLLLFLFLWKWTCSYVLAGKKTAAAYLIFILFNMNSYLSKSTYFQYLIITIIIKMIWILFFFSFDFWFSIFGLPKLFVYIEERLRIFKNFFSW